MKAQQLLIGEIVKPQGIKGEVKLHAESEDMSRYARLKEVYLRINGQEKKVNVLHGRASGEYAYLQIEGVNDRNAAETLRGALVYVDRADAISLEEGKYFICDLMNLSAVDEQGNKIGVLKDIQSPNQFCDVYVFDTDRGEMMMPALKRAILKVDIENRIMTLDSKVLEEIALWPDSPEIREDS